MNRNGWLLLGGIALSAMARAETKPFDFGPWAPGASPAEIGKRLAEHFVASPHLHRNAADQFVVYPEVCTWYGALTYAQLADDRDLTRRLVARFEPLFEPRYSKYLGPITLVPDGIFPASSSASSAKSGLISTVASSATSAPAARSHPR